MKNKKTKINKSLFTLIELLTVVAIISILATMLLPALKNAIGHARTLKCLSNQQQLGFMNANYAADYRGWTIKVYGRYENNLERHWIHGLIALGYAESTMTQWGDYGVESNYSCPSFPDYGAILEGRENSIYGYREPSGGASYPFFKASTSGHVKWSLGVNNWKQITFEAKNWTPSTMFYFSDDAASLTSLKAGAIEGVQHYKWSPYTTGEKNINNFVGVHARHDNKACSFFLDGHAKALTVEEVLSVPPPTNGRGDWGDVLNRGVINACLDQDRNIITAP